MKKQQEWLYSMGKKHKWLLIALVCVVGVLLAKNKVYWAYINYQRQHDGVLKVGFMTDIHAGTQASKEKGAGFVFPSHFQKNVAEALDDMKQDDYIISLGDNIDRRGKCDVMAQKLNDLTKNYNVIWTKGNHDKEACFSFLEPKRYYYVDVQDWRFLIIDNADWFDKNKRSEHSNDIGMISDEEMTWIKDSLKTDKKVLISMHVPLWSKGDGNDNYAVRSDYVDFKKMIEDSGNVKYVLSGHYHNANWNHEENGIHYYIIPSIDQQHFEGAHLSLDIE